MTTFQRSPEYRKQTRSFFLTNIAAVRKQITGVSGQSNAHAPTIMVVIPTTTSVILPGVSVSTNASVPAGTVDVVTTARFDENFSSYANSADFRTDPNGWYFDDIQIARQHIDTSITDPEVSSGQTLRWDWPVSDASVGCNDFSIGLVIREWQDGTRWDTGPTAHQQMWFEMRMRFADNWTTAAPAAWGCSSNPDHKQVRVLVGESGFEPFFQIKNGTFGTNWAFGAPPDPTGQLQKFVSGVSSRPEADGEWNVIRMICKLSTDESTPDGRVYVEVNGRRITASGFTGDDIIIARTDPVNGTGTSYSRIRALLLGRNRNNRRPEVQSLWHSRVRVYDADPGWIEGFPNQPIDHTGAAIINTSTPGSGGSWAIEEGAGNLTVVAPATGSAWKSQNSASVVTVPSGTANGATLVRSTHAIAGKPKSLYFALFIEPESNFEGNTLNRLLSFEHENKDGTTFVGTSVNFAGTDAGALDLQMYLSDLQGDPLATGGIRNLSANLTSAPIERARYYMIEGHLIQNTPGVSNGEVHVWVDGAKRLGYTNVRWSDSSGVGDNGWLETQINAINGPGPNSTVAGTYQIEYDHLYMTVN